MNFPSLPATVWRSSRQYVIQHEDGSMFPAYALNCELREGELYFEPQSKLWFVKDTFLECVPGAIVISGGFILTPELVVFYAELNTKQELLAALVKNVQVSVDVSTGDADAGNRVFGTAYAVSTDSQNNLVILAESGKPNFKWEEMPGTFGVQFTDEKGDFYEVQVQLKSGGVVTDKTLFASLYSDHRYVDILTKGYRSNFILSQLNYRAAAAQWYVGVNLETVAASGDYIFVEIVE